jgi:hypothetical protein
LTTITVIVNIRDMTITGSPAARVMELINSYEPDAVFVDGTGIGWGVVDRLRQLGCSTVHGIDFGAAAGRVGSSAVSVRANSMPMMSPARAVIWR